MGKSFAVVFGILLLALLGAGSTMDFRQVMATDLSGELLQLEQPCHPVVLNAEPQATFQLSYWCFLAPNSFSEQWVYSLLTIVLKESRKFELAFSVKELVYPFHGFW